MEERKTRSSHSRSRLGCITCKIRHMKCDETYPECGQCTSTKRKCDGYTQLPDKRTKAWRELKQGINTVDIVGQLQPSRIGRQYIYVDPGRTISSGPVFRDQLKSSFLHLHFPVNTRRPSFNVDLFQPLFTDIAALPRKTLMLEQAISAVSCVFLGKVDGNDNMLRHGLQLYNSSIRHMSRILSRDAYSADLVYTSMIFQEIEAIHCPQSLGGFFSHVVGSNSILKRYRHKVLADPLTAVIYHKHQKIKVFLATHMDMSEEDYEYISQPAPSDPMLELIHIIIDISLLSKRSDSIDVSKGEASQDLLLSCLAQKEKLMTWYSRWEERIGEGPSVYGPDELNSKLSPTDGLFGPAYQFSSLDNARLHIFFWVASTILYPLIHRARYLVMSPKSRAFTAKADQFQEEHLLSIAHADNIARSLPYCAQAGMNARGIIYGGYLAVRQLAKIYSDARCLDKFLWTKQVFVYMAGCGYDCAARGNEIVSDWWPLDNSH